MKIKRKHGIMSIIALLCISILGTFGAVSANAAVPRIIDTKTYAAKLDLAPSLVAEWNRENQAEEYATYTATMRPSNVIVHVNENLDAVKKGTDEKIGTLAEIYTALKGLKTSGVLTVVYVHDSATVASLSTWLRENDIYDIAVMSGDAALVKSARTANESIRGIVDYSAQTAELSLSEVVKETNTSFAHIVALSAEQATSDAVYYLHARFKAVVTYAEIADEFDLFAAVSSGAYGIITNADTRTLYPLYDTYEQNSIARPFYNIGHRGLPMSMPENTLECCVSAYKGGATAVEIDMKVSADDEIFIMHDSDLSARTDGPAKDPENMTLAQLRQYKVTKNSNGQEVGEPCSIPTIDDIFKYFQTVEDCVLVCEIKTVKEKIVELFANKLRQYNMYDKVVVIAFSQSMLLSMKEKIPEIPTAYLNGCTQGTAAGHLKSLQKHNTICDARNDHMYFEERNLKNRGYLAYAWTYYSLAEVKAAAITGIVGITNNYADTLRDCQKRIIPSESYTVAVDTNLSNAKFTADVETYGRETTEEELSVFAYRKSEHGAQVILQSERDGYILYSNPISVSFTSVPPGGDENPPPPDENQGGNEGMAPSDDKKSGCGSVVTPFGVTGTAFMLCGIAGILLRRRKGVKAEK